MLVNINEITGEMTEVNKTRLNELEKQEQHENLNREIEKKCEYDNWMQLNLDYTKAFRTLAKQSPIGAEIFFFIAEQMDKYNALICSRAVIAEALNLSIASIDRGIAFLKNNNYIKIAKSGTANVYYVNSELVWKSWNTNKKYAEFNARVIISETEQQPKSKIKSKNMKMVEIKK